MSDASNTPAGDEGFQLPKWVQPGKKFRYFQRTFHIRAIIDGDQVVIREWWPTKQRWNYFVEDSVFFAVNENHLKQLGSS